MTSLERSRESLANDLASTSAQVQSLQEELNILPVVRNNLQVSNRSGLKSGLVNPHIWVRKLSHLPGIKLKNLNLPRFVILSNIAITNNTSDCSIREY